MLNILNREKYFKENTIDEELLTAFRSRFLDTYCHGVLAYMYIYDKIERQKLLEEAKTPMFYFMNTQNLEMKLVGVAYKAFRLSLTYIELGIIKRIRKHRDSLKVKYKGV